MFKHRGNARRSGPLLDRIDIPVEVPPVDNEKLSSDRVGESYESIRDRFQAGTPDSMETILEDRILENYLYRRYAYRGNLVVLQIARGRSELNRGSDKSTY